jgi:hypothetical protein
MSTRIQTSAKVHAMGMCASVVLCKDYATAEETGQERERERKRAAEAAVLHYAEMLWGYKLSKFNINHELSLNPTPT